MNPIARRWAPRVAAAGAGAIASLAFPAPGWWWLGWVGLTPIFLMTALAPTRREALLHSWLAGAGFLVSLHYWLIPFMGWFTIPVGAFVGLFWLPVGLALWSFLRPGVSPARRRAALMVVPATWVVVEWVRSWEYLAGSWGIWGATQWQVEPVIQTAALGGVWLLSFLLVAVNVALAHGLLASDSERTIAFGVAVAIPLLMVGTGVLRSDPPVTGSLRVAGVQPGEVNPASARVAAHLALTASLDPGTYDVVVWGQSSVGLDPAQHPDVEQALRDAATQAGADLLVNIDAETDVGIKKVTTQYTGDGAIDFYDKRRLVPFGEYIPLRPLLGWLTGVTQAADVDRVRGDVPTTFTVAGATVGPLISYESTFPDMRREVARIGPDLTIVQGASTTFQGTWAQPQQASFEAIRAVESGRPAALVTLSGTSAAFDARGRRLAWISADERTAYVVEVPLSQEETPYVRFGDWVVWLSLGVGAMAAVRPAMTRVGTAAESEGR